MASGECLNLFKLAVFQISEKFYIFVKIIYILIKIMFRNQYLLFYNDFRKFREPPTEGLLKNSEGANENLPFFVGCNKEVKEVNLKNKVDYEQILPYLELCKDLRLENNVNLKKYMRKNHLYNSAKIKSLFT